MNTSILIATDANFTEVISSDKPVLIDFWAQWCGPSRAIAPALDQLAASLESKVTIAKLNVDENPEKIDGIRHHKYTGTIDIQKR